MARITTFLLLCVACLSQAQATLFDVEFFNYDGSQWTGVVDSTTDSLTITSWQEGEPTQNNAYSWWTPANIAQLTFSALQANNLPTEAADLVPFNVPDNWDGTIGLNWGFLSDLGKMDINWNEGSFTNNNSRLGWGIAHRNDGMIANAFTSELYFSFVPNIPVGLNFNVVQVLDQPQDYVTIAPRSTPTSVPTPSSLLNLLIAGLLLTTMAKRSGHKQRLA